MNDDIVLTQNSWQTKCLVLITAATDYHTSVISELTFFLQEYL